MKLNKYLPASLLFILTLSLACKKTDFNTTSTGEALTDFRLSGPATNTELILNAAIPNTVVTISWNAAKPGVSTAPTYKWIAALKSTGNLEAPLLEIPSNAGGSATTLTLTQKQIDDALAAKGIATGVKTEFIWSVLADNGTTKLRSQDVFSISITRMKDGATPFVILEPVSSMAPVAIDPGSTTQNFTFRWTKSKPATGGPAITYKVLFSLNGNFTTPLFTLNPNVSPADSTATITYKALSDSLNAHGQTNLSLPTSLKWTVAATSGTWKQQADFINDFVVLREVRLYMPGGYQGSTGNGTDWTPANAPEFIRDLRSGLANNMYYMYIYLPAGAEFKITQGRSWDVNFGGSSGTLSSGGANLSVATAGVYRISVNRSTMVYDIREGRMGFVGGATGANWTPPNVFPAYAMGAPAKNLFVGLTNFTTGGWKLIDNNEWNNGSNSVSETRSYGSTGGSGSTMEVNGANFPDITTPGRYRLIWDGRDVNNIKYEISPATEMRLVGDGMNQAGVNDWDPPSSPQMTYSGNGVWTITIALKANKDFKFLAANAWGAFDYEDNSGGSQATGTPRKIKWEGGNNFKTPATAGTYTITLDENNQTATIN